MVIVCIAHFHTNMSGKVFDHLSTRTESNNSTCRANLVGYPDRNEARGP